MLRVTARWGTRIAAGSTPCCVCTRTYMPGSSSTSGLANSPRKATWPVVRSTAMSENSRRPSRFWSVPSIVMEMLLPSPRLPFCMALRMRSMSPTGWLKST
ncbi:hypothetical protein D3C72_1707230 [compost metagenome]